jgi:hypothetical protein
MVLTELRALLPIIGSTGLLWFWTSTPRQFAQVPEIQKRVEADFLA